MKPKSGDKGAGEAITPSLHLHVGTSGKNVVIPGSSVMARRSANIQKANDGSLIYRRRNSMSSASAVTPESKGADALVQTRSQGKDASRSRMSLPIETRSDRKRPADSDLSQSMSVPKRRRTIRNTADGTCVESDAFCWICHRDGQGVCCELCPRLYHIKCLGIEQPGKEWICPECEKIMIAENTETRSKAMSMLSMETLCTLLKFVLQRMKYPETDPFHRPVDCALIPTYTDFIFNAMDFSTLEKNIKKKAYGSTEAFVADVKWILHNCIVFNGKKHRLTNIAKTILKVCRHEVSSEFLSAEITISFRDRSFELFVIIKSDKQFL